MSDPRELDEHKAKLPRACVVEITKKPPGEMRHRRYEWALIADDSGWEACGNAESREGAEFCGRAVAFSMGLRARLSLFGEG